MMSPTQPIRGKVARVLSSRGIAINRGFQHGVKIGMIFNVLSTKGSEITDPDTGESLGSVDLVKTSVKVTIVQERISVASTYRTRRINVGGMGVNIGIGGFFEPPKWVTRVETLKIDEASIEELDEEDAIVHAGDPIMQVFEVVPPD